jgi:putative membrane protein
VDAALAGERQQAREAAKATSDPSVVRFTERVLADDAHVSPRFERVERSAGITSTDNAASSALRSSTLQTLNSLRSAGAGDLDKLYIDAQVGSDRQVIALLDSTLIPSAQNAELRTLLEELRSSTARHLSAAEEIQSALSKK